MKTPEELFKESGLSRKEFKKLAKQPNFEFDCGCTFRTKHVEDHVSGRMIMQVELEPCGEPGHLEMHQRETAALCAEMGIEFESNHAGTQTYMPALSLAETPVAWAQIVVKGIRKHWQKKGRKGRCAVFCASEERADAVRAQFTEFELAWVDIEIMDKGPEAL